MQGAACGECMILSKSLCSWPATFPLKGHGLRTRGASMQRSLDAVCAFRRAAGPGTMCNAWNLLYAGRWCRWLYSHQAKLRGFCGTRRHTKCSSPSPRPHTRPESPLHPHTGTHTHLQRVDHTLVVCNVGLHSAYVLHDMRLNFLGAVRIPARTRMCVCACVCVCARACVVCVLSALAGKGELRGIKVKPWVCAWRAAFVMRG